MEHILRRGMHIHRCSSEITFGCPAYDAYKYTSVVLEKGREGGEREGREGGREGWRERDRDRKEGGGINIL